MVPLPDGVDCGLKLSVKETVRAWLIVNVLLMEAEVVNETLDVTVWFGDRRTVGDADCDELCVAANVWEAERLRVMPDVPDLVRIRVGTNEAVLVKGRHHTLLKNKQQN